MAAGIFNIDDCEIGATFDKLLTCRNKETGIALNFTGYTAKLEVRVNKSDAPAILTLTSDAGGGITLGGALGTIAIRIKNTQTSALPAGVYYYDLLISVFNSTLNETIATRLVEGTFSAIEGVTR
jgi:hypothetical protein